MNQRFDTIEYRLAKISDQVNSLREDVYDMQKNMMLSFQYMGKEIDRVQWKIDRLAEVVKNNIFKEYNFCNRLELARIKDGNQLATYQNYVTLGGLADCKDCLKGLYKFIRPEQSQKNFYLSAGQGEEAAIEREIVKVFEPSLQLFKALHVPDKKTLLSLMFPVQRTSESQIPLMSLDTMDLSAFTEFDYNQNELQPYYNYWLLPEFSKYFSQYSGFFEIYGNVETFQPMALNNLFSEPSLNARQNLLKTDWQRLKRMLEIAIMQQSIVSGTTLMTPIYYTLFNYNNNKQLLTLTAEVLNQNQVIALNFATFLVNRNLNTNNLETTRLIQEAHQGNEAAMKALSDQFSKDHNIKIEFAKSDKRLYLRFNGNGQEIKLIFPHLFILKQDKMLLTESLLQLVEARNLVCSKLLELNFLDSINNENILNAIKYDFADEN